MRYGPAPRRGVSAELAMRVCMAWMGALGLACWPALALGQDDAFGLESIEASADLRASVVGGEQSWLDGGFGKLRYGGDSDGDTVLRPRIASLDLAWKPQISWNFSAVVSATFQD